MLRLRVDREPGGGGAGPVGRPEVRQAGFVVRVGDRKRLRPGESAACAWREASTASEESPRIQSVG